MYKSLIKFTNSISRILSWSFGFVILYIFVTLTSASPYSKIHGEVILIIYIVIAIYSVIESSNKKNINGNEKTPLKIIHFIFLMAAYGGLWLLIELVLIEFWKNSNNFSITYKIFVGFIALLHNSVVPVLIVYYNYKRIFKINF